MSAALVSFRDLGFKGTLSLQNKTIWNLFNKDEQNQISSSK
ncbi:hypothetical protein [Pedobacter jeongneungensis]|nr:hypothetical protein [Pedobacter jeongneungensis]